eukprot:2038425-Karenia_brevis.AAC.1
MMMMMMMVTMMMMMVMLTMMLMMMMMMMMMVKLHRIKVLRSTLGLGLAGVPGDRAPLAKCHRNSKGEQ